MEHFLFLTFLLVTGFIQAQSKTDSTSAGFNLSSSAEKMGQLFVEKNYTQYVKNVHPKVLKIFGGEEKMIDALKKTLSQMEQEEFAFEK